MFYRLTAKKEDRRFYIATPFGGGCSKDWAWIMVKDSKRYNPCSFDKHEDIPAFLYSPHTTKSHFGDDGESLICNYLAEEDTAAPPRDYNKIHAKLS